jgi:hypothetical protein
MKILDIFLLEEEEELKVKISYLEYLEEQDI